MGSSEEGKAVGNVLRVFKRDVLRLFKAPAALVVVLVLVALPSLYTWFNVIGFWNPYDNTGNLRVCVVNEDAGTATDLTGELDLGDQIVEQIESNTQLGWTFTDRETAMDEVRSGKAYAAFVIPRNFSADLASLLTGDFRQPKLEYYVNEKAGAVSPKITDTGATTLEQTINSTFVSTVSRTVADTLDEALAESEGSIDASKAQAALRIEKAQAAVSDARASVAGLRDAARAAQGGTCDAQASLQGAKGDIDILKNQLNDVSALTVAVQNDLGTFAAQLATVMDEGSMLAARAAAQANTSIGAAAGAVTGAQGDVEAALKSGQAAADQNDAIIKNLSDFQQTLPDGNEKEALGSVIANLQSQNDNLRQVLKDLGQASAGASDAATAIAGASDRVNTAIQGALDSADGFRGTLSSETLPAVNSGLSQIAGASGSLAGAVSNQALLIDQALLVLGQLDGTLQSTTSALDQTDGLLANLEAGMGAVRTDLAALGTSDALAELFGGTLDAGKISDFMLSPTELRTESLYPLNAYGSAMAPLFTNLTLWIGVFMLMVILKQEVDDEGIPNLTTAQRYLARWLFLAPLAALQAIVCCTGNLIIGVQAVSVPLFYLTAVVASLTYLSIQFALSVTLQHVGKGICVILVFVQIPGATGLYPIEMTQSFFQSIYPVFPFTYGINALRETIAGFYDGQWAYLMGVLLAFLAVSFVVGLLVRPYLTNVNRMFAKQIRESDILNGEDVQVPRRRYRLGQLIRALSDREEYRVRLEARADQFLRWYPRLKRGAWVFGIVVPTVLTVACSIAQSEKVVVLTMWLVWLVLVILFLVVIEHVRDNLEHQIMLESMSDEELRGLVSARNGGQTAPVPPAAPIPASVPASEPAAVPDGAERKEGGA